MIAVRPFVYVQVSGGVVDVQDSGGVEVIVVDWDNEREDPNLDFLLSVAGRLMARAAIHPDQKAIWEVFSNEIVDFLNDQFEEPDDVGP